MAQTHTFNGRRRVRKFFGKIPEVAEMPNLIEVQKASYDQFLMVDEPKAENAQSGTTAGWNAGTLTGRVVQRVAPMLGIAPDFSEAVDQQIVPAEVRQLYPEGF